MNSTLRTTLSVSTMLAGTFSFAWAARAADSAETQASLQLPSVFGDHMVLQEGQPVPVWGWARAGEAIRVSFQGQSKHARAGDDGAWKVELDPLATSDRPATLVVTGGETVTLHDVLVGEVWLCSGQSNMQKPVGAWRGQPIETLHSRDELAAADFPAIRLLNEEISNAAVPQRDVNTRPRGKTDYPWTGWIACSPESLDRVKFSAVGYFFGRKLYQSLKTPIGLIEATAGGTHVEAWTPAAGFDSDPQLGRFARAARTPGVKYDGTSVTTLYNGMIHPLVPFALSGVLWYQGESNLLKGDGPLYAHKFTAVIRSWRQAWGRELPFYFVQLPPYSYSHRQSPPHTREDEPIFWEAQAAALSLPHTGMVVTTDVGDLNNLHPPRKKEVGERLALWALAEQYGHKDIEPSGPIYRDGSMRVEDGHAVLHFSHSGKGLASRDGLPLTQFTVAGSDGTFYPARAEITRDAVSVSSVHVPEPNAVRFAWDEAGNSNFINADGLPAAPFRTDRAPDAIAPPDARIAFFRAAKYGLFIHWGLYALPAGVWKGRPVRPSSEWIMAHARIPVAEYEQLARQFNPVRFDAEQWVRIAQRAGMKYVVFTAKHGDGFAMYHSRATPYNIYDATPFHRDPLRELADACARHGLKLGLYYSQSVDWHEPGGEGNSWDFGRDSAKDKSGAFDGYLRTKVEPQIRELLTNYGPICEIFFDTPALMTATRAQRIADLVHSLQPACLIDGRLGVPGDYLTMGDNGIPSSRVDADWETPGELNHNWGFDQNDSDYKSPSQVLFNLVDVVSKGGNYLLDVGPTASGEIPEVAAANLAAAGRWLQVNGEAVYGAGRSPFGEGFGALGHLPFLDWRCTRRPGKLYFTIFRWPSRGFELPAFQDRVKRAYLLGDPERTSLTIEVTAADKRRVATPHYAPDVMASVVVAELDGDTAVLPDPTVAH